jgi:hypothetical protein
VNISDLGGTTLIFTTDIPGLTTTRNITGTSEEFITQRESSCMLIIGLTGVIGGELDGKCIACSGVGSIIVIEMVSYGITPITIATLTGFGLTVTQRSKTLMIGPK